MGLQMPGVDGKTAVRRILDLLGTAAPPIIALTANALTQERDECLAMGMAGYFTKPFDADVIVRAIKEAMRDHPAGCNDEDGSLEMYEESVAQHDDAPAAELDVAGAIERCGGDEALFRDVLDLALPQIAEQIDATRLCLDDDSVEAREALRQALHSLKGGVQSVGLTSIGDVLGDVENGLRDASLTMTDVNERLAPLGSRLKTALAEIRHYLGRPA